MFKNILPKREIYYKLEDMADNIYNVLNQSNVKLKVLENGNIIICYLEKDER